MWSGLLVAGGIIWYNSGMNKNAIACLFSLVAAQTLFAANTNKTAGIPLPPTPSGSDGQVVIDLSRTIKPIRIHNAINGAPDRQGSDNFDLWREAEFSYVRTHDLNLSPTYEAPYVIDVPWIFRDFDADENDPRNYDFACTDTLMERIHKTGSKAFYRLGGAFENHLSKKYTIYPPKDFAKWARICERIIAHYTQGWANGYEYDIEYWEIWNEPNHRTEEDGARKGTFWRGTRDQFKELFKVALKHLKGKFPHLKFGGPAMAGTGLPWGEEIVKELAAEKVPLDFYSWHKYETNPKNIALPAQEVRRMLDRHGFTRTESILNEWNYVKGWNRGDFTYSLEVEKGRFNQKGAAYIASAMNVLQSTSVDVSMFYDARIPGMNSLFDAITGLPMRGYYPFIAWRDLRRLGTQVAAVSTLDDVYVTAAKDNKGGWGIFVVRYDEDNNVTAPVRITLRFANNESFARARCRLTDDVRLHTETGLLMNSDGSADLVMRPCSFAYISLDSFGPRCVNVRAVEEERPVLEERRVVPAKWCSLGTSITWYDSNVAIKRFTKGYQTRVLEQISFTNFVNKGVNGGTIKTAVKAVVPADLYTIEHGVNDWGQRVKPGTFDDYLNRTATNTFAGAYREVIESIRAANPKAKIILCTPRKSYGFGKYLPPKCDGVKDGGYRLIDYVEIVRKIAAHENFVIADFYGKCGEEKELAALSIDKALHPNDAGYQRMANELVRAILKVYPKSPR